MTTCGKGGTRTPSETVDIPNWDGFGYKSPAKSVLTCIYYTMILAFICIYTICIISNAFKSYLFGTVGPWWPPLFLSRVLCCRCHEVRLMGQQQLDTSHCFNPGCMDELRRVILQSGADLVVTSSWRQRLAPVEDVETSIDFSTLMVTLILNDHIDILSLFIIVYLYLSAVYSQVGCISILSCVLELSTDGVLRGLEEIGFLARRSHVRFETARNVLAKNLGHYGLRVKDWTTTAGGESNEARVDQILSYVTALDLEAWAVVDDEAPWPISRSSLTATSVDIQGNHVAI